VIKKYLIPFFLPSGFIFLTLYTVLRFNLLETQLEEFARFYPYIVLVSGALLGIRSNQSRILLTILILLCPVLAFNYYFQNKVPGSDTTGFIYSCFSVFLPFNLMLIFWIREKGLLSASFVLKVLFILVQLLIFYLIYLYKFKEFNVLLSSKFFDIKFGIPDFLPQVSLFLIIFAFLISLAKFLMNRNVMESGFIWLLVCVLFSFYNGFITGGAILYLSTSGLIVIASFVETSFGFAYRDQLTGLMSRRSMDDYILTLGGNYTISLIDIDFFKKFNDRYGHDVGDQVLRMISLKLKKVGGRGKVFRYGGEEFAVVFAGKKLDKAIRHMEELRGNISKSKFIIRGIKRPKKKPTAVKLVVGSKANVRITVSLGVADNSGENTTPLQVIKSADLALYRAKKSGRNKVCY